MTAAFAKAPILAWLLTALTCFVAGMALTEGRRQVAAPPVFPPVGVVVTIEVAAQPTAAPTPPTAITLAKRDSAQASRLGCVCAARPGDGQCAPALFAEGLPHPEP